MKKKKAAAEQCGMGPVVTTSYVKDMRPRHDDQADLKARLLACLASHIGEQNAIGMAELFVIVYGEDWKNRINDTRRLRYLITKLRAEGVPLCSVATNTGGGYYIAAASSELYEYLRRAERRALLILMRNATIKKVSLPDYLGQLRLDIEGGEINGKAD